MGKNRKRNRNSTPALLDPVGQKGKQKVDKEAHSDDDEDLLAAAAAWAGTKPRNDAIPDPRLPPPYPSHLLATIRSKTFLRDQSPDREAFVAALDTCFEGCVWDKTVALSEKEIQNALSILDQAGFFRTDVIQPNAISKTYVTRCLMGEPGTTYKYLGLRMFALPWTNIHSRHSKQVQQAVQTIAKLNEILENRAREHLSELQCKRQNRGACVQGRPTLNIALINKMTVTPRLKDEPMFRESKCTVSWHADSSLEHYSTIAVYQTLIPGTTSGATVVSTAGTFDQWSVALRVAPHAEGPNAKRLGDISVDESCPAIAISLPSGSAYYLLDDFNHHHQHAVLSPNMQTRPTVRYSSTHRLLRKGHTVHEILERCRKVFAAKPNRRRWRGEQVLLNEIEFEWLRQFYVQGSRHKQLLWHYWSGPITELWQYWSRLEDRSYQLALALKHAAQVRCRVRDDDMSCSEMIFALSGGKQSTEIYDRFSSVLSERAKLRELWDKRERDPIFQSMPADCRPLVLPVRYGSGLVNAQDGGASPFSSGAPSFLNKLAGQMEVYGVCYRDGDCNAIPNEEVL